MKTFLLLNAISPDDLSVNTFDEIQEAAQEFGCDILLSEGLEGVIKAFITSNSKQALESLCTTVDLDGTMVEVSAVYDQLIRV